MTTASEISQALLHHEATGGEGPCLLLLHGMLSSRFQWTPNLDALVAHTRPTLLELWGHGLSPTPVPNAPSATPRPWQQTPHRNYG